MDNTGKVSTVCDGLANQSPVEQFDPTAEEHRLKVQRWSCCCHLNTKETEYAIDTVRQMALMFD